MSVIPRTEPARGLILAEIQESGPPKDGWSSWRSRRWLDRVGEGGTTRVFVGRGLTERVRDYDRTDRPVEPETIGGGTAAGSWIPVIAVGTLALLLFAISGISSPVAWFLAATWAVRIVVLVRRRALFSPVVAGQGWVEHGKARWTSADSVLFVDGWPMARVRVVGPAGVLTLRLRSARHGELEALWTRWMHPAPNLAQRAFDA